MGGLLGEVSGPAPACIPGLADRQPAPKVAAAASAATTAISAPRLIAVRLDFRQLLEYT